MNGILPHRTRSGAHWQPPVLDAARTQHGPTPLRDGGLRPHLVRVPSPYRVGEQLIRGGFRVCQRLTTTPRRP
jgi:hypothetical protein